MATNLGKQRAAVIPGLAPWRAQVYEYCEYGGVVADERYPEGTQRTHHLLFVEWAHGVMLGKDNLTLVPYEPPATSRVA